MRYIFRPVKAACLLGLVLVPILLQALAEIIPGAVVAEHIVLAAAETLAFGIGAEHETGKVAQEV